MSPETLVIYFALVWLIWRVAQLWSTPLTLILRHLQIEIPAPPRLSIDALTADSVSLHWAPPESQVKRHIILMDGQEVGISLRGETSVTISGLTADYLYSIQVVAVNLQGFQVASQAVYVRTRPKGDDDEEEPEEPHEPRVTMHAQVLDTSTLSHRLPKKSSSVDISKLREAPVGIDEPKRPDSKELIEDLTSQMDAIRKETTELELQLGQMAEHQLQEESTYLKRLEDLRMKKKEDDDAKTAKDHHHKHLDQQKREIETKRNQAQRALKTEQDAFQKQATDITSFISSTKNSIETVEHLQESMKNLATETDEAVQDAERTGAIAAEELSEIESEIRYLLSRKAESEAELTKLLAESRVSSPSAQELAEAARNDALWREREESLARQYDEFQQKFLRLSNNAYNMQEASSISTPGSDPGHEHAVQMRRRVSRRGGPDEIGRPDSASRSSTFPTFNPDAAPFVVSSPVYTSKNPSPVVPAHSNKSIFSANDPYNQLPPVVFPTQIDSLGYAVPRTSYHAGPAIGTSSIFVDEPAHPRNASPFARRESPKSSQSGSNPPSPAVQTRGTLPSIFNAAPGVGQRTSSGSLVASLNGTPLSESDEKKDSDNWFRPIKKKAVNDPLALDRTNARSLPKADVAPIGTRRNRSGSLLEENAVRPSVAPAAIGYHDLDLLNAIGHPLSREASAEKDGYSTSAFPLPRPSNGRAFGWDSPRSTPAKRHLSNLWNSTESDSAGTISRFDPFGDLPARDTAQLTSLDQHFLAPPATYHTTIDASKMPSLDREASNGSRKSNKSKAESHDSKEKAKRLGDNSKFSSFVGRMFNSKKEEKDQAEFVAGMDDFASNGITSD